MNDASSTTAAPVTPAERVRRGVSPRQARPGRTYALMAEFDTPAAIYEAAKKVRAAGFRWWDCHVPFPVHGLDKVMGIKPTILPILVFFGGLTGTTLGVILQWFTNAASFEIWALVWVQGYDFIVSGKPFASVPAWIPVVFELTILLAALSAFGLSMLLNGLPRLYHPVFKSDRFHRATNDRFFLVIEARDPKFSRTRTEELLRSLNPLSIETLEA